MTGDVRTLNATVTQDPAAVVSGEVRSVDADLVAFGLAIAPAIVLLFLGFALVTIVAALALAALAARQVRSAEALIREEPLETFIFGLAGLIVVPLVAILAMVTIIGAPLGFAILFMVWPAAAFAGYLVAGIWIGEWLLYRNSETRPDRPYLASVLGLIVLQVAGIVPFVGADRQPVRVRRRTAARLADLPRPPGSQPVVAAGHPADGCLTASRSDRHRPARPSGTPAVCCPSQAMISSTMAGPSGSLWSSWRRPG